MRILGIDPGSIITGYGIVENKNGKLLCLSSGRISTAPKASLQERMKVVFDSLCQIVIEHKPDAAAVEAVFFAKNVRSAILLGQARGVAVLCAGKADLPVFEYSPATVKQSIVGYGNATKQQVQLMVKRLLKMHDVPKTDASDALAVAICHIHHYKVRSQGSRIRRKNS